MFWVCGSCLDLASFHKGTKIYWHTIEKFRYYTINGIKRENNLNTVSTSTMSATPCSVDAIFLQWHKIPTNDVIKIYKRDFIGKNNNIFFQILVYPIINGRDQCKHWKFFKSRPKMNPHINGPFLQRKINLQKKYYFHFLKDISLK